MKLIGLIGGMSHESTAVYYQTLNRLVAQRLGGLHSARLLVWSFDFADIAEYQASGNWHQATEDMLNAARSLKKAGAQQLLICTNTMHYCADDIERETGLPVCNIIDAVKDQLIANGIQQVLLLGTKYTMSMAFYRDRLSADSGPVVTVPNEQHQAQVNDIIYDELCRGITTETSQQTLADIVRYYRNQRGCQAVILGCTELGMLLDDQRCELPCYDALQIHCHYAIDAALK
ncbi:aspartate/glutamate racemase family protein [Aestuariibacter salexigens]|uniref:aspartate/glutamate racemase family protein n=1 Tax=Aestuariibacter salexigens TaxID=226010 RepID=UPI0003F81897|nr:aspartate/glutamate racemase family protein [Aestuariibacter salexigens]